MRILEKEVWRGLLLRDDRDNFKLHWFHEVKSTLKTYRPKSKLKWSCRADVGQINFSPTVSKYRKLLINRNIRNTWFLHVDACVLPQVEAFPVSMEDTAEQNHWVSPALLSSDPLASFSSESGLLPPGEEGEAFFSSPDTDYTSLPSFFSNPSHNRAMSTYRQSSGQYSHTLLTHLLMHPF